MTGDDLAEKVAAVLGEHRCNYHHRNVGPEPVSAENLRYTSCEGCDWLGGHHDEAGWEVHLAAALLPLIREREAAAVLAFAQWVATNRAYNGSDHERGQALYNECLNAVLPKWATDFAANPLHRKRGRVMSECPGKCVAPIPCTNGMPGCGYPEPHNHGFACDKTCAYCHGRGVPVYDPENHPNHKEWR